MFACMIIAAAGLISAAPSPIGLLHGQRPGPSRAVPHAPTPITINRAASGQILGVPGGNCSSAAVFTGTNCVCKDTSTSHFINGTLFCQLSKMTFSQFAQSCSSKGIAGHDTQNGNSIAPNNASNVCDIAQANVDAANLNAQNQRNTEIIIGSIAAAGLAAAFFTFGASLIAAGVAEAAALAAEITITVAVGVETAEGLLIAGEATELTASAITAEEVAVVAESEATIGAPQLMTALTRQTAFINLLPDGIGLLEQADSAIDLSADAAAAAAAGGAPI